MSDQVPDPRAEDAGQAIAFLKDHTQSGSLKTLDRGIHKLSEVALANSGSKEIQAGRLGMLSEAYLQRYLALRQDPDFDSAVEFANEAIRTATGEVVGISDFYRHLARVHQKRFDVTGEIPALDTARDALDSAIDVAVPRSPALMDLKTDVANLMLLRYTVTHDAADLQYAVDISDNAIRYAESPGNAWDARALLAAGQARSMRFSRFHKPMDLQLQIDAVEAALPSLETRTRERVDALIGLGTAFKNAYRLNSEPEVLSKSIELLECAVDESASNSAQRGLCFDSLANALVERYRDRDDVSDLREAVSLSERGLPLLRHGDGTWFSCANNLGVTCMILYRLEGERGNLDKAIDVWSAAIDVTPGPADATMKIRINLSEALRHRAAIDDAPDDRERALALLSKVTSSLKTEWEALPVSERIAGEPFRHTLNTRLVGLLLEVHREEQALVAAENDKAELFRVAVQRQQWPGPPGVPSDLLAQERSLLDALTELATSEFGAEVTPTSIFHGGGMAITMQEGPLVGLTPAWKQVGAKMSKRRQIMQGLEKVWNQIAEHGDESRAYVAMRRGNVDVSLDCAMFEADHDRKAGYIAFSGCTHSSANHGEIAGKSELVMFSKRQGEDKPLAIATGLSPETLVDIRKRLDREIIRFAVNGTPARTWNSALRKPVQQAIDHLNNPERLVISNCSELGLIPWAAAIANTASPSDTNMPAITIVPSLAGLRSPGRSRHEGGALVVGDPGGDLPHARDEASSVALKLGVQPLIGSPAKKKDVLQALKTANTAHFACHGVFDEYNPLASGLVMADGVITTAAVLRAESAIDLLVLSSCETGRTHALGGNEIVGLADAFIRGGVRSVVVSLWRVADVATATLMTTFHDAVMHGVPLDAALASAMADVRAEPKWSHPYFWAGFMLMGDPAPLAKPTV